MRVLPTKRMRVEASQSIRCSQNIWNPSLRQSECDSRFLSYRRSKIRDQGSRVRRGYILDECTKVGFSLYEIFSCEDTSRYAHVQGIVAGVSLKINLQSRRYRIGIRQQFSLRQFVRSVRHDSHFNSYTAVMITKRRSYESVIAPAGKCKYHVERRVKFANEKLPTSSILNVKIEKIVQADACQAEKRKLLDAPKYISSGPRVAAFLT